MPHRTFNIAEVADYLHVPVDDVEQMVRHGDIPFAQRGAHAVFHRGEIDAWASQRILGLPAKRLARFHETSLRETRSLLRSEALLPGLIRPEYIDVALAAKTKASVVRAMVGFAERTGRVGDGREFLESVQARETLCPTALPGGLALLHARNHDAFRFDDSFLMLGRTVQSIPFGAPDGYPTRLFLLLCLQDERLHLHTLARICLMALKTDLIADLFHARDAEAAYGALLAAEEAVLLEKR